MKEIEIDNFDDVVAALNGDMNITIVTTDWRLPQLLCRHINKPYIYITEDMFINDKATPVHQSFNIKVGQSLDRRRLIDTLTSFGYVKMQIPAQAGEFSVQGDVIDFWPGPSAGSDMLRGYLSGTLIQNSFLVRVMLHGSCVEAVKIIAARSFARIKDLDDYTLDSVSAPMPEISLEKVRAVLDKNHGKVKTVVFENPDTIELSPVERLDLDLQGFTCIGFQMTDATHNLFDVARTVFIRSNFEMPAVGDLVVHAHHGLGRFIGFKKMRLSRDAPEKTYLVIQYAKNALVYLPPDKTELLSNYHGYTRRISHLGH